MIHDSSWRRLARRTHGFLAGLVVCALVLSACSGSAGSGGSASQSGTAMITLTDNPGDFMSYVVTVDSLQLTRSDGTVVETVPAATQVDFSQLVDLSEIISAEQIPAGQYTTVTLTLSYTSPTSNAESGIIVDNGTTSGLTIPLANILNSSGSAALSSPVTMTLQLPAGSPLVITSGTVANLALDFNLAATNKLVTPALQPVSDTSPAPTGDIYIGSIATGSGLAVEVSPALAASLAPDTSRQIRVRGTLASVGADSYTVDVRPFFNASGSQGTVTVDTTNPTTFIINGTAYNTQMAGLAALNALVGSTPPTLTVAYGTFDATSGVFTANEVLAGSSVPGASLDGVEGTVTARTESGSSDTLTVSRGRICRVGVGGLIPSFGHAVTVDIGPGTMVTEEGRTGSYTITDLSVGQHVQLFGKFSDSSGAPTLDATAGSARLMVTGVLGTYLSSAGNGSAGSVVTLGLQSLDGLPPAAFQFAGTGVSGQDATASGYTVGVPVALSLPAWTPGAPAAFAGFVTPFGTANGTTTPIVPDFSAVTLVNYTDTDALLLLDWMPPGAAAPFASLSSLSTDLVLAQSTLESAKWYRFGLGPESIAAATLTSGLTLTADTSATMTQFGIAHLSSHRIDTFASFAALVTALYGDLNPGMGTAPTVIGVFAEGPYDPTTFDLSVDKLAVALSD